MYCPVSNFLKQPQNIYFFLFTAHGALVVISISAWLCILAFGSLAHKSLVRLMVRGGASPASEAVADLAVAGVARFPVVLAVGLTAMALGGCGSLALCAGTFLHFVHLFGMYKDHLEKLVKNAMDLTENKDREFDLSPVNIQFTIALRWVALTVRIMLANQTWLFERESRKSEIFNSCPLIPLP